MEKIRELISLLESGIEDYDAQLKVLQTERLKYIRLSMTNGFGAEEGDSKESWLLHLKQLEDSLTLRRDSIRQAVQQTAEDIQKGGKCMILRLASIDTRKLVKYALLLTWLFAAWAVNAQEMTNTEIIEEAIPASEFRGWHISKNHNPRKRSRRLQHLLNCSPMKRSGYGNLAVAHLRLQQADAAEEWV